MDRVVVVKDKGAIVCVNPGTDQMIMNYHTSPILKYLGLIGTGIKFTIVSMLYEYIKNGLCYSYVLVKH